MERREQADNRRESWPRVVGVRVEHRWPGHEPANRMDAADLICLAASLGVTVVQIADNLPLQSYTSDQLRHVRAVADDHGVSFRAWDTRHSSGPYSPVPHDLPATPVILASGVIDTATEQPSEAEIVDIVSMLVPELAAAGVTLAIENHDRFEAVVFARIVEQIASDHVGICLDTVNSFGALEGPAVVIDTLAPYVVNLHLKDFVIRRHASMMGFEITVARLAEAASTYRACSTS